MSGRSAIVCGAGGFIGGHLVRRLLTEGYKVRAVDQHFPYGKPDDLDLDVIVADLRDMTQCQSIFAGGAQEVYQLAAHTGRGHSAPSDLHNDAVVNLNVLDAAATAGVDRYFLASSVYVNQDAQTTEGQTDEGRPDLARPGHGHSLEKLSAERAVYTYAETYKFAPRVARLGDCYGPFGHETGPVALCRRVAGAADGDSIDVPAGEEQVVLGISDLIDAVRTLMSSDENRPTPIGGDESVTTTDLAELIGQVAHKRIDVAEVPAVTSDRLPVVSYERIRSLGWQSDCSLRDGLEETYRWVEIDAQTVGRG